MKKICKLSFVLLILFAIAGTFQACKKEERGEPRIRYVRLTDAQKADSLITSSFMGGTIAIVGENLGGVSEAWFNNRKALLVPTYISDKSLIVNVPSVVPTEITNKIKLLFSNGKVLEYDFKVNVNRPLLSGMQNEYALEGQTTTIRGNFFYAPVKVIFTGGAEAEIVNFSDNIIEFKIPVGAQPGPITVSSNFGETRSNFYYKDDRNIIISSDPYIGWWGAAFVVTTPGPNDPPKINGNYIRVTRTFVATNWVEIAGGSDQAYYNNSRRIPDESITNPDRYYLKFEVNTLKPYNGYMFRINLALPAAANYAYLWQPPFDSKGKWETVTIPFEDVINSYKNPPTGSTAVMPIVRTNGYFTRLMFWNPTGSLDCDMAFDNFRIVPKVAPIP